MPRSPSRDRVDRFTGNRGYFRQPDGIRRAKNWLALIALGLSAGWAVVDATAPDRVRNTHTHGPVATVHARWEDRCETCHRPHDADSLTPAGLFQARDRWLDLTCTGCHAGPAHHAKVPRSENGLTFNDNCANCHHDHGGPDNSLVRLADSHCTTCHANLPANHTDGKYADYPAAEKITNFADPNGHPEFRELAAFPPDKSTPYPRGLKFSHSLHMTPGMAYPNGGPLMRLKDLASPAERQRYLAPGQTADEGEALVQLQCDSCHLLDSGYAVRRPGEPADPQAEAFARLLAPLANQPKRSILPPRPEGAYFLPVNFDLHCKACHPLAAPGSRAGELAIPPFELPHRKQPAELREVLAGLYAARLTDSGQPGFAALGGTAVRESLPRAAAAAPLRADIERMTDTALSLLMAGAARAGEAPAVPAQDEYRVPPGGFACGKCHYTDNPNAMPHAQHIAPVPDKTVWFTHAKFNHSSHRATACAECHPNTGPPATPEQALARFTEREPILIRGVDSCRHCHSPQGGFRHGCTDCHRYHNNDHPLQGRGATARDPATPLGVAEFLRGDPSNP